MHLNGMKYEESIVVKCFMRFCREAHSSLKAKFYLGNMPTFYVGVQLFQGGKTLSTIITSVPPGAKVLVYMRLH